jgi:hypothetical protein
VKIIWHDMTRIYMNKSPCWRSFTWYSNIWLLANLGTNSCLWERERELIIYQWSCSLNFITFGKSINSAYLLVWTSKRRRVHKKKDRKSTGNQVPRCQTQEIFNGSSYTYNMLPSSFIFNCLWPSSEGMQWMFAEI